MTAPIRATTRASSYKKKTMLCSLDAIFISFFFFDRTRPRDRNSIISLYFLPLSEPFTLTNTLRKFFELVAACFFFLCGFQTDSSATNQTSMKKRKRAGYFQMYKKNKNPTRSETSARGKKTV